MKANFSSLLTALICVGMGIIGIYGFGEYGFFVFLVIPFLIGFLPTHFESKGRSVSKKEGFKMGFWALGYTCAFLIIFALEGLICLVMAMPLVILCMLLGVSTAVGPAANSSSRPQMSLVIVLAMISGLGIDANTNKDNLIPVQTSVIIDAPREKVWHHVVTFDKIEEPRDWIFKTGLAYPTDATIEGTGVGAIRYCNFSTGPFIEPITTWDEPRLLQFDVESFPAPMKELNPFHEISPPHLDGYFSSKKGQFELIELEDGRTELRGTTWYGLDMGPQFYWKWWSDFVIHRIHLRVLNHIKINAEL